MVKLTPSLTFLLLCVTLPALAQRGVMMRPLIRSQGTPIPFPSEEDVRDASRAPASPSILFRGELSKNEVFAGEQVLVNFVVYSQEDVLDIEVAKFPEFRGFWSENMSLRQGPIPLMSGGLPGNVFEAQWKKANIGAYVLSSMLGKNEPQLLPMKIMIRRGDAPSDGSAGFGETHECAYEPLKIKPLPPLPAGVAPASFLGGVGIFNLTVESTDIPFEKDEPTTLRVTLQGEGNFQEIGRIPLPPDLKANGVDVISERAIAQGSGQFARKTFETTLGVHKDASFQVPSFPLVYFNPVSAKYVTLTVPALSFRFVPRPPQPKAEEGEPLFVHSADERPGSWRPLSQEKVFWLTHLVGLFAAIGFVLARTVPERRRRARLNPEFLRRRKWERARGECRAGRIAPFLRLADELALELLAERLGVTGPITRKRVLSAAEKRGDEPLVHHARRLFEAYETYQYSPSHDAPADLPALEQSLAELMKGSRAA